MQAEREHVVGWFRELRDWIVVAFEELDGQVRFEVCQTKCGEDGGGGLMFVMCGGRVFEKVGVNWLAVHGTFGVRVQVAMVARGVLGMESDLRFWASGISLVVHM